MRRRASLGLRLAAIAAGTAAVVALSGCDIADQGGEDLVAGKTQFIQKCGSCHVLARAGTKGVQGPNLDEAFRQARIDGFGESTFEGIVLGQIANPNPDPQYDPQTLKPTTSMPAKLAQGDDAEAIAAYVARAAARGGEDTGVLASVGGTKKAANTEAKGGVLTIPADKTGLLAYDFNTATAPPGALKIDSPNPATIDHNIALEGGGINELGPVVRGGGVSTVNVNVQPGEYVYYCSVEGHREGGMEGKLTVK